LFLINTMYLTQEFKKIFTNDNGTITVMKKKSFISRIALLIFLIMTGSDSSSKKSNTVAIEKNPKCIH
jgi:hypothetical protein